MKRKQLSFSGNLLTLTSRCMKTASFTETSSQTTSFSRMGVWNWLISDFANNWNSLMILLRPHWVLHCIWHLKCWTTTFTDQKQICGRAGSFCIRCYSGRHLTQHLTSRNFWASTEPERRCQCHKKSDTFHRCWLKCWDEYCARTNLGAFHGKSFFMSISLKKVEKSSTERRTLSMTWWNSWKGIRLKRGRKERRKGATGLRSLTGRRSLIWTHQYTQRSVTKKLTADTNDNNKHPPSNPCCMWEDLQLYNPAQVPVNFPTLFP